MERKTKAPRVRVPNFTVDEKALLTTLIKSRPIIESKAVDGKTVEKKKDAWESITHEFNCQAYVHYRDTITLKRAWDNMKALKRKSNAAKHSDSSEGRERATSPTPSEEATSVIKNQYDSDGALSSLVQVELRSTSQDRDESNNTPNISTLTKKRKSEDFSRREGFIRLKHFEVKKRLEAEILNAKLATQEIKKQAAEAELKRNKILLEKAALEMEIFKNSLNNKSSPYLLNLN